MPLRGAFIVELERQTDERGFFSRTWCAEEFAKHGLEAGLAQCSISFNASRGTLRGMHWQGAPRPEAKLVRCSAGAVFDVIVDLRRGSPTFLEWTSIELSADNRLSLYVPPLCAHGFITLTNATQVEYSMSSPYVSDLARGFRWSDPAVGIRWPLQPVIISPRDSSLPLLERDGS
ncbi:MAG: dTDP-4-dehydrorhamnose 3,5-epimerase family protein [Deltaproteobacteria bacterium]